MYHPKHLVRMCLVEVICVEGWIDEPIEMYMKVMVDLWPQEVEAMW